MRGILIGIWESTASIAVGPGYGFHSRGGVEKARVGTIDVDAKSELLWDGHVDGFLLLDGI